MLSLWKLCIYKLIFRLWPWKQTWIRLPGDSWSGNGRSEIGVEKIPNHRKITDSMKSQGNLRQTYGSENWRYWSSVVGPGWHWSVALIVLQPVTWFSVPFTVSEQCAFITPTDDQNSLLEYVQCWKWLPYSLVSTSTCCWYFGQLSRQLMTFDYSPTLYQWCVPSRKHLIDLYVFSILISV